MTSFLTKIIGDRNEWKAMEARASRVPRDYRVVYGEMKSYMWRFTSGDAWLSGALTYLDRWRATLNLGVAANLAK